MYHLKIEGGHRLEGIVDVAGAKNAALPLIAATILSDKKLNLSNVPNLSDIKTMFDLLKSLGTEIEDLGNKTFSFHTQTIKSHRAEYEIVSKMRASVIVLGGLLARNGYAEISLPGGCAIGARPINLHLQALEKLGAKISLEDGYVKAEAKNGLVGAEFTFSVVSVGATQNTVIAATLAKGTTKLYNAAAEPEIADLADMLNKMGAKISGAGTSEIIIEGVSSLNEANHAVVSDRIEAGTYLMAGAITGGKVTANGINPEYLAEVLRSMQTMGIKVSTTPNSITVESDGVFAPTNVVTEPFPGFPTDMQAQITSLMCVAKGKSHLTENIFENRFMHIPELMRMGAKIEIDGNNLIINGIERFKHAEVMATDLRASVCLVLAGLNADGTTILNRLYHLDRGYEKLEEKLNSLGAKVCREKSK